MTLPGPLRLRAAMTESPFPEHSLHCPHKRATHFSEPLVVMPKAIRAVQLPGPGFFQDSEEGFFLPMDKRARFPAPNTCSFLRRKKHILMSSLSALPGSLQPGPTCLASLSRAPWHAPSSLELCFGGAEGAQRRGRQHPSVPRGWQKPGALGPCVVPQPGSHDDLPVIYCHNINHAELTWH